MKNSKIILLLILITLISVVVLGACTANTEQTDDGGVIVDYANIETVELDDGESLIEVGLLLDTFKVSDIKLRINYYDGENVVISASDSMVKAEDKAKLTAAGVHSITLIYGKFTIPVSLKLYTQQDVKYTVTFLSEEGDRVIDTQYLAESELAVVPSLGTKTGYTFVGWKDRETNQMVTTFSFNKNTTLVAIFAPNSYEVKYYTRIGEKDTLIATVDVPRGESALDFAPEIPIVSGYSNGRWENEEGMNVVNSEGLEFFAIYDRDKVLVTFSYYKYTEGEYYDYDVSWYVDNATEGIVPPDDVENVEDYVFTHWYVEKNDKKIEVSFPYKVTAEINFIANYISYEQGTEGLVYSYNGIDAYTVVDYVGDATALVIPEYHYDEVNGELPVTTIKDNAFAGKNVSKFYVSSGNRYFRAYDYVLYNVNRTELIAYPSGNEKAEFVMSDVTEKIRPYAFYGANNLQSVTLSNKITQIGKYAFSECYNLETITIPDGVTVIEEGTFLSSKPSKLTTLNLGDKVTTIGDYAFYGLTNLESLSFTESLVSLGSYVFYGCNSLTRINVVNNEVFTVYKGALYGKLEASHSNPYYFLYAYPAKYSNVSTEFEVREEVRRVKSGAIVNAALTSIYFETASVHFEKDSIVCPSLVSIRFGNTTVTADNGAYGDYKPGECYALVGADLSASMFTDSEVSYYTYASWNEYRDFSGNYAYVIDENKKATIVGYKGREKEVVVPNTFGSFKVSAIGKYAFAGNTIVEKIVLPENLEVITKYAFVGCSSLVKVEMGSQVKNIGDGAFAECTALKEIVTSSTIESCGEGSFDNTLINKNEGYTIVGGILIGYEGYDEQIVIPEEVSIIYDGAFENKYNVKSIEFAANSKLKVIGERAFANCCDVETITLPESLNLIKDEAFAGCAHLYLINGLEGKTVGENVFVDTAKDSGQIASYWVVNGTELEKYTGSASELVIPTGITAISNNAFENNNTLTKIILNADVISIGERAFANCENLQEVVLNEKISTINKEAFLNCANLVSFEFDKSPALKSIDSTAFNGTRWLAEYVDDSLIINGVFYAYNGSKTELHVKNSVTKINDEAFRNNATLTTIYLPESLKEIGKYAFANSKIQNVNFATTFSNVTLIDEYAFYQCKKLVSLDLALLDKLTTIGKYAFAEIDSAVTNALHVFISSSVTEIGESAFERARINTVRFEENSRLETIENNTFAYCQNLVSVVFNGKSNLYEIGTKAFYGCSTLRVFTNSDCKLESIEEDAFKDCIALEVISITENNITFVGNGAFDNVKAIEDSDDTLVYIGTIIVRYNGVRDVVLIKADTTGIGNGAFSGNAYLTEVIFLQDENGSSAIKEIQSGAFSDCEKLTKIVIPESVESLGDNVFSGCSSLNDVTISNGVVSIGDFAFKNCVELTQISLPSTTSDIGEGVFVGCEKLTSIVTSNEKYYSLDGMTFELEETDNGNFAKAIAYAEAFHEEDVLVTDLIIPDVITVNEIEYKVTALGSYLFAQNQIIQRIELGNNVEEIGSYAFEGISADLDMQNANVNVVNDYAFAEYKGKELILPSMAQELGDSVFYNATELDRLVLPSGVKKIGSYSFYGVKCDVDWSGNETIDEFSDYLFIGYKGNLINIPVSVTKIGKYAFSGVQSSIVWNADTKITVIGDYAFNSYRGTQIEIPESVTTIGGYAFERAMGLLTLNIPKNVKEIGTYAFANVNASVEFDNESSIVEIGPYAFAGYLGTEFTLPKTVETIGAYAFLGAFNVQNIDFGAESQLVEIGNNAFTGSGISEVVLPKSVVTLGEEAFFGCYNLTKFDLVAEDNTVVYDIAYNVLGETVNLSELTLPNVSFNNGSNSYIGYVFGAKSYLNNKACVPASLKKVTICAGRIKANAFYGCDAIEEFNCLSDVTALENSCLVGCTSIKKIDVPYGDVVGKLFGASKYSENTKFVPLTLKDVVIKVVSEIKDNMFNNCVMIERVTLPESIVSIGNSAFYNCRELQYVNVGKEVNIIGSQAFAGCFKLTTIDVDENNTHFATDNGVLYKYDGVTREAKLLAYPTMKEDSSYTISFQKDNVSYNVVEIAPYAFYYAKLVDVTIPSTINVIGDYAFAYSALAKINLPTANVSSSALYNCLYLNEVYVTNKDVVSGEKMAHLVSENKVKTFYVLDNVVLDSDSFLLAYQYLKLDQKVISGGKSYYVYTIDNVYRISVFTEDTMIGCSVSVDGIEGSISGQYVTGSVITLTANAGENYKFVGWYNGATLLSEDIEIEYVVEKKSCDIKAIFEMVAQG